MTTKGIQITARDVEILKFINDFGFCELPQLLQRFGLSQARGYQLCNRLIQAGLLEHERVFYGRGGVYRLTKKGAGYTELPPLKKIPLSTYRHDLTLIKVYLKFRETYPEAVWISERTLKKDQGSQVIGKRGHVPDGILVFPDGKQIAIEIELAAKSKYRLGTILKGYNKEFSFKEVWYCCLNKIEAYVRSQAARMNFVKIYTLRDILGSQVES